MKKFSDLKVVIENPKGSYKSFEVEGDPVWEQYPLKGVTYPVDYGYIEGYMGEDGAELDIFVGTGNKFGHIKIWRTDVPEETKFYAKLMEGELARVIEIFKPVLISQTDLSMNEFMDVVSKFKTNNFLYRYTSNGEGIWSAGKRFLPEELISEAWEQRKWMPKPKLPEGEYQFFLTEKGKQKYDETLLNVHKKYLTDIKFEKIESLTIGDIVYQDEWQVVTKK
ncbi:MAG: hypothetical protein HY225_02275 [Candidatus Vogelbacteria bacterium]|nr:hypothetical protein [Candidatus Vogelbacteria bacterium]